MTNYQPITFNEQVFSCRLASVSNMAANLVAQNPFNGSGTVLINSGTLATLTVDGVNPILGDRILVAGQTAAEQNGVYFVSEVGSATVPWVLTRSPDWSSIEQLQSGQYVSIEDGA